MTPVLLFLIIVHVAGVLVKISVFFVIPRLRTVSEVQRFTTSFRKIDMTANIILWITGGFLIVFFNWRVLIQPWMIVSLVLYLMVFLLMKFALTRELAKVADSRKLLATDELKRLRTNNWCVGLVVIALFAVIAYLMMTKP